MRSSEMQCNMLSESMLDVIYGEADAATRQHVESHVQGCAACRVELDSLRGVRKTLSSWKTPELGRPARRQMPSWVWSLAAAAVLLVAAGLGLRLARVEIRSDGSGTRIAFGVSTEPSDIQRLL